jgi:DNA-directed RNA polymerase subunit H (RpoH/RPB5)
LYNHDGIFVVIHNIQRLQFNILEHELVPQMTILSDEGTKDVVKQYNLTSVKQLPEIDRFDPVALALSMRPDQVGKIVRSSITALKTVMYRVCI